MVSIVCIFENRGKYEKNDCVKIDKNQQLRDNQSIGIEGLRN